MKRKDVHTPSATELTHRDIVCLYSQEDEPFYTRLKKSLHLLERHGQIRWLEVLPGKEHALTWQHDVQRADLILFLLSSDFFADERCYSTMHLALQERACRQVPVVPILVRAVNWRLSACKDLAIVPHNEQPVASWPLLDEAYASIGVDLVRLVPGWPPIPSPTRPRVFQARDLPKGYVPRLKVFDEIKHQLLNHQRNQTMAITTALRGAGGFGKTTLALALCHDPDIQAALPDGILWVELGEQPPRSLDMLNGVLHALEPSLAGAITLEEARDRWRTALEGLKCLFVIDDVWHMGVLEPLLESGPQCRRLVTTRNDQVLPEEATRVWVDAMEPEEAIAVLRRGLPEESHQQKSHLEALVTHLGCWPLLLTLANGMLTSLVSYGQSFDAALAEVKHIYGARGVTAFQLDQAEARQGAADACLQISVQHLERFTRPHYHAADRYQELAVFPEDTDIPLATLEIFWKGTGGLEPGETKDLCIRLHRLSLLLTCDLGKGAVRLHDVMRSYLIHRAGAQMPALHTRLLTAYWQALGLRRWADLPTGDTYIWQYLILHLCKTGHRKALEAPLTDLWYLTRKALFVGVAALEADLLRAYRQEAEGVTDVSSLFALLHRTIGRISHLLRQVATEAEIGGLLLSHLGFQPSFAAQRAIFERELARPHLSTWHPLPERASAAILRTLHGHTDWIFGCAVSPNGQWIVSASSDNTLKVWGAATGAERLTLEGHSDSVKGCAVSPDGQWIISASRDDTMKVWDAATGAERLTLEGHCDSVNGCAVSPNGQWIVSASDDETLKVWDATTGAERLTLEGHTDWVNGCAVSPNGQWIVSASDDETLKVWDAATGAERFTLEGHSDSVKGCAVSPDGQWIVSASSDNTLKVWDAATGAERLTLEGHTRPVKGCAVSPDGQWIVSASNDETLKMWDAATGAECRTLKGHSSSVEGCAMSPDGRWIVSASRDDTMKMWDTATEVERLTLEGHTDGVNGCAISPDGRWTISASDDETLKVWDAATGAERRTLKSHNDSVNGCAVSPDGRWIISASSDNTLKVWDTATGAERRTLKSHNDSVNGCAVSPDGRWIVSASRDGMLKMWDTATGAGPRTLKGHSSSVEGCAISPDGRWIVSASRDNMLKTWDTATRAERLTLKGHTSLVFGCAVSPDGQWIASVSDDHTLKVWNAATGQCLLTFPVDGALFGCAFHPDGEHLVACGAQGMYFLRLVV